MKMRALCLIVACLACLTCGCDTVLEQMGKKNCRTNPANPAGANKRVALFVKSHIFVVGQSTPYDPNMTSLHPIGGFAWKNGDIVKTRAQQIGGLLPKVNTLFENNGDYFYLYDNGYDVRVITQDKLQADMDNWGDRGKTADLSADITSQDPTYIHLLWLWTSTSKVIAVGVHVSTSSRRYIVIGDDPIAGSKLDDLTLAHEFVHALGFDTHINDPSNLMNDGPLGTKLNQQQLQIIWNSLNDPADKLLKFSCDK